MRQLPVVVATTMLKTRCSLTVTQAGIEAAVASRTNPVRLALARRFPHLMAEASSETFGLRHPDDGRLVARGVLPWNAHHLCRLVDQGVAVRGAHINLAIEWYEVDE